MGVRGVLFVVFMIRFFIEYFVMMCNLACTKNDMLCNSPSSCSFVFFEV